MPKVLRKETYYFIDKDGEPAQRVTHAHPLIGEYVVRASRIIDDECQAVVTCEWLNKMVVDRGDYCNGVRAIGVYEHMNLFKVVRYKETKTLFVIVRRLLFDDLVSGIEELVEVKAR